MNPPPTPDPDATLAVDVATFARMMSMSVGDARQAIAKGDVPRFKIGGRIRIPMSYVEELLASAAPTTPTSAGPSPDGPSTTT